MAQRSFNSLHCDTNIIHSRECYPKKEITVQDGKQVMNVDGSESDENKLLFKNLFTFIWICAALSCKHIHTRIPYVCMHVCVYTVII